MSKRVIHTNKYGDGKFIRVENKPKGGCAERAQAIQEMISWARAQLGGGGTTEANQGNGGARHMQKPTNISAADIFGCPTFTQILLSQLNQLLVQMARTDPKRKEKLKKLGIDIDALIAEAKAIKTLHDSYRAAPGLVPVTYKKMKTRGEYALELFRAVSAITLLIGVYPAARIQPGLKNFLP